MPRLFGTDGVRGVANQDLTPDLALALGRAAARVLAPDGGLVIVGRDTRISGPMLEGGLVAGLCSGGADVRLAGIIPTAAVAYLAVDEKAQAGAVISASHNPVPDNGIKFFSDEGYKIGTDLEEAIEEQMESPSPVMPTGTGVGVSEPLAGAADRYADHLLGALQSRLTGLRVVLDCAFGAAHEVAPRIFRAAGADVHVMNADPDGRRINVDCGSTSMDKLAARVIEKGADVGFGFDGDADRVLAVDDRGQVVDGDRIIAVCALKLLEQGELDNHTVVVTVMANLGLRRALEQRGITVITTPVGDRQVAEAMLEHRAALGGEQSGHIIFSRHATTGDGILTAAKVADTLVTSDRSLSQLGDLFETYPQVLINVPVTARDRLDGAESLWAEVSRIEESLGDEGRVLLRPSGTEPIVRVMVEASDAHVARRCAQALAEAVVRELA